MKRARSHYAALEAELGYTFRDRALLETALTHPSYGGDHNVTSYQRLEFLGDAVLELSTSRILYERYPALGEGQLTRLRSMLVREETLSEVARAWAVGPLIRLSAGEEKSGGADKPSILSDVCEAVLAAVYLDGGMDAAFALVIRMLESHLPDEGNPDALDAKSRLQEVLQHRGDPSPDYELIEQGGPAHQPVFRVRAMLKGEMIGEGSGQNKRAAQQQAALDALNRIQKERP